MYPALNFKEVLSDLESKIPGKIIYLAPFGSLLYGTNHEKSDIDIKGIYIPYIENIIFGETSVYNFGPNKLQINGEQVKNQTSDMDIEIYSLREYCKLLQTGQTVGLDMLFAYDRMTNKNDYFYNNSYHTQEFDIIWNNKELFFSKKMESFVHYCRTQAKKYSIKGDRVNAVNDTVNLLKTFHDNSDNPGVEKLNIFSTEIEDFVKNKNSEYIKIVPMINQLGNTINFLECCDRKASYTVSLKEAYAIFYKLLTSYGKRAVLASENDSNDWKALSHSLRIAYEAIEFLSTQHITFPLINSEFLLDVKMGKYDYQTVSDLIDELLLKLEKELQKTILPTTPKISIIKDLVFNLYIKNMEI